MKSEGGQRTAWKRCCYWSIVTCSWAAHQSSLFISYQGPARKQKHMEGCFSPTKVSLPLSSQLWWLQLKPPESPTSWPPSSLQSTPRPRPASPILTRGLFLRHYSSEQVFYSKNLSGGFLLPQRKFPALFLEFKDAVPSHLPQLLPPFQLC